MPESYRPFQKGDQPIGEGASKGCDKNLSPNHVDIHPPHFRGNAEPHANNGGAEKLGHVGYLFPHDDPRGWVEQEYVPGLRPGTFYQSDAREAATFEKRADQFHEQVTGRKTPRTFR